MLNNHRLHRFFVIDFLDIFYIEIYIFKKHITNNPPGGIPMSKLTDEEKQKFRDRWKKEPYKSLWIKVFELVRFSPSEQDPDKYFENLRKAAQLMKDNEVSPREVPINDEGVIPGLDLRGCTLESGSYFLPNAHLEAALIYDKDLSHSSFTNANFRSADVTYSKLIGAGLTGTQWEYADLHRSDISDACLDSAKLHGTALNYVKYNRKTNFLNIDTSMINRSTNPQLVRDMEDAQYLFHFKNKSQYHRLLYYIWYLTCDCGRSFLLWLSYCAILVWVFALVYMKNWDQFSHIVGSQFNEFAPYYYSIITFTTLGFGDITPKITLWWLQMIVTLEVILGYVMLGGLISIFANKLARRAS